MPSGSGITVPRSETIDAAKKWNKTHKTKMKIATPSEFFGGLEKYEKKLKIRTGEMYSGKYSEIFPDVASSRIWLKKELRRYENKLLSLEKFCTITSLIDSCYPEELRECWKKVLFLGFHDVVPGTGMDRGYEEAKQDIGFLNTKIKYLLPIVLKSIVENDTNNEASGDLIVFNPLSWEVSNWVETDLEFDKGQVFKVEGLKNNDKITEVEVIRFARYEDESLRSIKIGFVANVPPTGYKVYKIMESIPKYEKNSFIKIIGNTIENKFFKVKFSSDTGLIEVFKNNKRICKGNELVIEEESGDLYYHRETLGIPLKTERGEGIKYGSFKVNNFWIDKSPLRRVINIETNYYSLRWPYRLIDKLKSKIWRQKFIIFKKKIIIYRDIPRIDFVTYVENNHPMIRLRVKFDTNIKKPEYTCETQFGAIKRKTNQYYLKSKGWVEKPSGVSPSIRWIDYGDGKKGLTVINKGNPENEVRDGNIYLTLMRSVEMLSSDGKAGPVIPVFDAREIKKYKFKYSIYPHEKDWKKAMSYKQGYEFNYNLLAFQLSKEKKYRAKRSFLGVEPDNIIVTALKKAEDEKGIIIRFYEACGRKTETTLTLFKKPKSVEVVNLIEEKDKEFDKKIKVAGKEIRLNINPFEIVSLKVKI
jgi:alpha-mannosidase